MKILLLFLYLLLFSLSTIAQNRLDIQGDPASIDTVVKVVVNYSNNVNVIALSARSEPFPQAGIGGLFYGGQRGVFSKSPSGTALYGESTNGIGVFGTSTSGIAIQGNSTSNDGVRGFNGGTGKGVSGISNGGVGVNGQGTDAASVGVSGVNVNGTGVKGFSENAKGVVGSGATFDFDAIGGGMDYGATSSRRWKRNISNISDPLDKISLLRGVYFDWDEAHGGRHDLGFIAEEIGEVLPEIVGYEENGVDATAMDYSKMSALLVEAVNAMRKEYQEKFDLQQLQIDQLKGQIEILNQSKTGPISTLVGSRRD